MLQSITLHSELLTLSGLSFLSDHGAYIVQETPDEPNFWMGNQLILRDQSFTAQEAVSLFETHFPKAKHRSIVWDIPNLPLTDIDPTYQTLGLNADSVDALVLTKDLRQVDVPDGIKLRPMESSADWAAAADLAVDIGIEEGYNQDGYRTYVENRIKGRKVQISKGLGQWFGAFDGGRLVCQMGIFHDDIVARYQSVETRITHRKRGIASALLRHAALWALDRAPKAKVVIVAEVDGDAGRLYRSMGFTHAETIHGMLQPAN